MIGKNSLAGPRSAAEGGEMEQILQQAKRAKQASEELALWGAAAGGDAP